MTVGEVVTGTKIVPPTTSIGACWLPKQWPIRAAAAISSNRSRGQADGHHPLRLALHDQNRAAVIAEHRPCLR